MGDGCCYDYVTFIYGGVSVVDCSKWFMCLHVTMDVIVCGEKYEQVDSPREPVSLQTSFYN